MYVIHILATEGRIPPSRIVPGENCVLGHRIFDQEEPLLAHGQQFIPGLEVDAGFQQGANLFLRVHRVRCKFNVVEVYFLWNAEDGLFRIKVLLEQFGYQVIEAPVAVKPMIEDFFTEV